MSNESTNTEKDSTTAAATPATNSSSSNNEFNLDALRKANFDGKIPVKLTLAQTSLSSAVIPQPMHMLVSRQTFLHVGLEDSVRKLHEYALPTLSFLGGTSKRVVQEDDSDDEEQQATTTDTPKQDGDSTSDTKDESDTEAKESEDEETTKPLPPYPVCWFEDVITGQPLRWQYFAGVLFDSLHSQPMLPWEIRLHFRSYPSDKLLELCDPNHNGSVLETIRSYFKNSLKQAFVIRYGNPKEALNLSKMSHDAIWDGIIASDYDKVAQVIHRDDEFEAEEKKNDAEDANAESKENTVGDDTTSAATLEETKLDESTDAAASSNDEKTDSTTPNNNNNKIRNNNLVMVPVRLSIDPIKPMIQKRLEGGKNVSEATLGSLFNEWAKDFDENSVNWKIAGLTPSLSTPLLDLWLALKHPDNFLYISLSQNKKIQ